MALNPTILAATIKSQLDAEFGPQGHPGGDDDRKKFAEVIAQAIVNHFKANGLVIVSHPMGPGTGTIT